MILESASDCALLTGYCQAKNDHYTVTKEHNLPRPVAELLGKGIASFSRLEMLC